MPLTQARKKRCIERLDMTLRHIGTTDEILTKDAHLIQSFSNLHEMKQNRGRTAIVGAAGAYVTDSDGNQLLDGMAGLWCVNVGHGREEIITAIADQLRQLDYFSTFYSFTHPVAAQLAEKIAQLAPEGLNHVYFSNSGSVANDTAIRILHHYNNRLGRPNKKKILSRVGAYHGSTHLAIAMTTPLYSEGWDSANELVHHLQCPHKSREASDLTDAQFVDVLAEDMLSAIHDIGAENIACFIAEPIMGAGGVIVAPEGYHKRMQEITQQHDIKYISDEVVTAFGRLGHMFASEEVFGVRPDIITTAKGLTSGYQPLAATILSDEIYDVISEEGAAFLHGMTYSGHPAAAAAALANIDIMEREEIPKMVRTTGKIFEAAMRGLGDLDIVGEVRGSHFMIAIEFSDVNAADISFDQIPNIADIIAERAQAKGLIARPIPNGLVLSPPLTLTPEQISEVEAILRASITEVATEIRGQ